MMKKTKTRLVVMTTLKQLLEEIIGMVGLMVWCDGRGGLAWGDQAGWRMKTVGQSVE